MSNLSDFLSSKQTSDMDALKAAIQKQNQKFTEDDRFWYPQTDKSGKAEALIRFLPSLPSEELPVPWVRVYSHGFKGPTGVWYFENCPSTLSAQDHGCPVCANNSLLWNNPETKAIVSGTVGNPGRKRKMTYITNILILNDPQNPENNGQVRLFKFGLKIYEQIMASLSPKFNSITPVMVFHLEKGANYNFRICKVENQTNYDQSSFASPTKLFDGDVAKLTEVVNQIIPLKPFIDPTTFKTNDRLAARMNQVLNNTAAATSGASKVNTNSVVDVVRAATTPTPPTPVIPNLTSTEAVDSIDYFKDMEDIEKLAASA